MKKSKTRFYNCSKNNCIHQPKCLDKLHCTKYPSYQREFQYQTYSNDGEKKSNQTHQNDQIFEHCRLVVLSVKPQVLQVKFSSIAKYLVSRKLVYTIRLLFCYNVRIKYLVVLIQPLDSNCTRPSSIG